MDNKTYKRKFGFVSLTLLILGVLLNTLVLSAYITFKQYSQRVQYNAQAQQQAGASTCNFTIPISMGSADAKSSAFSGIKAGDTVCLESGERGSLYLYNFNGAFGKPITFINKGGTVKINVGGASVGLLASNSKFIRFTSNGNSPFGFEVYNSRSNGVSIGNGSSDVELAYFHIHDIGRFPLQIKSHYGNSNVPDANGNGTSRDDFTQYNTVVHDNYIHDIGTEAIYIGSSNYNAGKDPVLKGVRVYNNRIERAGYDGIQIGSAIEGVEVFDNTMSDIGLPAYDGYDGNNQTCMQINPGTFGNFYNNKMIGCGRRGIYFAGTTGAGERNAYNNLIVNAGSSQPEDAIKWNGGTGKIYNNTLVTGKRYGISVGSDVSGKVINNLIVGMTSNPITNQNSRVTVSNNTILSNLADAKFVNPAQRDYHITDGSPSKDAGSNDLFSPTDIDGQTRPSGSRVDTGFDELSTDIVPTVSPIPSISLAPPSPTPTPTRVPSIRPSLTPTITPSPRPGTTITPSPTTTPTATPAPVTGANILKNPSFDSNKDNWSFWADGTGSVATAVFSVVNSNVDGNKQAEVSILKPGSNVQLYQYGISLEPYTKYVLTFDAYSSTGRDLEIFLHEHDDDYTNYASPRSYKADLSTTKKTFSTTYSTIGFSSKVSDARIRIAFGAYGVTGDKYYIDNIKLIRQ